MCMVAMRIREVYMIHIWRRCAKVTERCDGGEMPGVETLNKKKP